MVPQPIFCRGCPWEDPSCHPSGYTGSEHLAGSAMGGPHHPGLARTKEFPRMQNFDPLVIRVPLLALTRASDLPAECLLSVCSASRHVLSVLEAQGFLVLTRGLSNVKTN